MARAQTERWKDSARGWEGARRIADSPVDVWKMSQSASSKAVASRSLHLLFVSSPVHHPSRGNRLYVMSEKLYLLPGGGEQVEEVWLGLLRIMLLVSRCAAEALLHTSPTVQHQ